MTGPPLSLWRVAPPPAIRAQSGTGTVALAAPMPPAPAGAVSAWFHEATRPGGRQGQNVEVWLPAYRGKSLVRLLSWLFTERIGGQDLTFSADYGVFSPRRIDAGTALLATVAMAQPAVDTVADIGIGYGALAISLLVNEKARSAVATDVDSVALWLAETIARRYAADLKVTCT